MRGVPMAHWQIRGWGTPSWPIDPAGVDNAQLQWELNDSVA